MGELIRVKQLPVIEEQLRTLKESVERRVDEAMRLAVTDETLSAVKSFRADMNRDFADYEAQRKAVKAAIMEPYERFEAVYRECVSEPFRRADLAMKDKIAAVEQGIKAQCEETLVDYFNELCAANRVDFLTFEQMGVAVDLASARQKTPKKLMEILRLKVEGVAADLATISGMEHGDEIAVEYKRSLDFSGAVRTVGERHKLMEQEKERKAAMQGADMGQQEPPNEAEPLSAPARIQKAAVETLTVSFTVTDTRERLKLLKQYLVANGYKFK